ncbi:MAG: hypothetical protein P4L56_16010 [Candidatus Sulfopaludibacter sp.]|nr:hypothetical protein [Candidatus Sulfopaludibacter sp.]
MTTVSTSPPGPAFAVDGTNYINSMSAMWPQGSKHTLSAQPVQGTAEGVQYMFSGWSWSGGQLLGNPAIVTADPSITSYQGIFTKQYRLTVMFNNCPDATPCPAPGVVLVNGAPIGSSQTTFVSAGSGALLQAYPNDGYVFAGWLSDTAQTIQGFQTSITMNAPATITAIFAPVQFVNLATVPSGLSVLADRTQVFTPIAMQWGLNTTHSLAPVSPQQDNQGAWWVFNSWSDGGAPTHAYTVPGLASTAVTATYGPGVTVDFFTNPQGLKLTVDGASSWSSYSFVWGIGQTHTVSAPATQTDSKGNIWAFSDWSNGGTRTQNVTVPQSSVGTGMRMVADYTQLGHLTVTSPLSGLSVSVNGSACAVPCDIQQPLGTQITIATPASVPVSAVSRQDFAGWSNGAGTGPLSVTLGTSAVTVAANYHQMNYLATATAPSGAASFSLQPASPDSFYDSQANVTVAVAPLPGFRFQNWSGDLTGSTLSGTLSMSAPRSVQAVFKKVPYIAPGGVSNGAGSTPQSGVAAGSVVSIFGANLADSTALGPASPMAQTLGGLTLQAGGRLLPLFFVSPTQINFQLPDDLQPGVQTVTVSGQGQPDVQASFTIVQDAPGLFPMAVNDQTYAVATHADGTPVTLTAPVQQGETITLYGTGFGPTTPARPFGFAIPDSPSYALNDGVTIQIGSAAPVVPVAAYAVPESVGVDAVQFTLGSDAPSGTTAQLTVTINGQVSNMVLLPIQ